jgi:hypothetical protein
MLEARLREWQFNDERYPEDIHFLAIIIHRRRKVEARPVRRVHDEASRSLETLEAMGLGPPLARQSTLLQARAHGR